MIGRALRGLRARWQGFWELEDPEARIQGSGEVHLDPAYNGRYTAERRLRKLSKAQDEARNEVGQAESPEP